MRTIARAMLAVGVFLLVCGPIQAASVACVAHELELARSKGRVWRHSEGWLARMIARGEVVEGQFVLPRRLEGGKYHFFLKARSKDVAVRISCGGGVSAELVPQDTDWNGPWSDPIPLDVAAPSDVLTMTFVNKGQSDAVNFIFQGLYVTDQADLAVDGNDCLIRLNPSSAVDPTPEIKGNLIPNSSFEAGLGQGWLFSPPQERRDYSLATLRDDTQGCHGRACLQAPPGSSWMSRVVRVRPDRKHSLSLWAKAGAAEGQLTLELASVHAGYENLGLVTRLTKAFRVGDQWERLSIGDVLGGFPAPEYQVRIRSGDTPIRIDAVQLEEGDVSNYVARKPIELGLLCEKPGNIFFEDERVTMRLLAFHSGEKPVAANVCYEVYDYLNRNVKDGKILIDAQANGTWEGAIDLNTGRRGAFRTVIWMEGSDGSEEEAVYSVVPRPQREGPDPTSMIGVHASASDVQYDVLRRLGVKWTRILSPEAWFRWHAVEPQRGKFIWYDAEAEKTVRHGFEILGTIGTNTWPQWAYEDGTPDLDAWEECVFELVSHYRRWVKHWEVWNEPIHQFDAGFYAQMLHRAARAIRKADPEAKIVGMGGSYDCGWCLDAIGRLGDKPNQFMDCLSTHLYPAKADPLNPLSSAAAAEFRERVILPYGMEVWNTEAGAWCLGFYQGANSGFRSAGEPVWPSREAWRYYRGFDYEAARVARSFLHSIGNGFNRYFYYDTRFHAAYYGMGKTHCTIFDLGDTIRTKGVAYAILARFFDHSRGLGNVSPNPNTFAYLFDRGGTPLAAVFAADEGNVTSTQTIAPALSPGEFRAYDMMGNEIRRDGATVPFGRQPVYLEAIQGLSTEALKSAIQKAVIAEVADTAPPTVSLSEAPRGATTSTPVRIRWIAIDEAAIPCDDAHTEAIQYSYRLSGRDTEWSDWSARTRVDYERLAPAAYRFEVKAKDAAGNVSAPVVREFAVAAPQN